MDQIKLQSAEDTRRCLALYNVEKMYGTFDGLGPLPVACI
jgi:hypothetical protein